MPNSKDEMPSLEDRFEELDNIINQMESGEISLDQSFELYKKGLNQLKEANLMLDKMEKTMMVLNADGSLEEM